jgi:hypothetical protein
MRLTTFMTTHMLGDEDTVQQLITRLDAQNLAMAPYLGETVPPQIGNVPGSTASSISTAAAAHVYAAAIGAPPKIAEFPPSQYLRSAIPVDRFALNPGRDYYVAQLPGSKFAYDAQTMFGFGDYPVITGSGVDPAVLRWVPWVLRHSAAFTERRSLVLAMIEDGLDGDPDPERLQTEDGRMHLGIYFSRISQWVTAPVDDDENGLSAETIAALYPPGQSTSD